MVLNKFPNHQECPAVDGNEGNLDDTAIGILDHFTHQQ